MSPVLSEESFEEKADFLIRRVKKTISQNRYYYMRSLSSASNAKVTINEKEYIMYGSNNYLGLSSHPKVKEAAINAIKMYGVGSGGSRVASGTMDLHNELEKELADLKGTEDAIVYNSGYLTNLGLISTIADKNTLLLQDKKNHASLIDGSLLSGAKIVFFKHNDMNMLENLLSQYSKDCLKKTIITDGIFSMDGDIANLPEILGLAQKYNAKIIVDDAHSTGILGKEGGGTAQYFNLENKIDFEMGTLSKAIGGGGGFVASDKESIFLLKHMSRQFIFSTALPPSSTASALAALKIIKQEPERRLVLLKHAKFMRDELKRMGYNIGLSKTQIIPVIIGDEFKTYELVEILTQKGIFALPATYPAVRKKDSRIRMSMMATHTTKDITKTLEVFEGAGKTLAII